MLDRFRGSFFFFDDQSFDGEISAIIPASTVGISKFAYLLESNNAITPQATYTAENADSDLPASNVAILPISRPCLIRRLNEQKLLINLPTPASASVFALINHNLTHESLITLRGGNSVNPSGLDFQIVVPWAKSNAFVLFNEEEWQYWSLEISDPTNRDGFLKLGLVRLGMLTVPDLQFRYPWKRKRTFENIRPQTEFGTPLVSKLFNRVENQWDFGPMTQAETDRLSDLIYSLDGDLTPAFVIPDYPNGAESYFGRFAPMDEQERDFNVRITLSFAEDGQGRVATKADPFRYIAGDSLNDSDAEFTRASIASWISDGLLVKSSDVDVARDAHLPNRAIRTILLEATRTNSWTYSEGLNFAGWLTDNSVVNFSGAIAPNGQLVASKIIEDSSTGDHGVYHELTGATENTYQAVLIHARSGERRFLRLTTLDKASNVADSWVDLATGNIGTHDSSHLLKIRAVANGFTEVRLIFNSNAGGIEPIVYFRMSSADAETSYAGNSSSGLYLWGAQWEKDAPNSSSYISTIDETVVRAADTLFFPFVDVPQSLTLYIRFIELGTLAIDGLDLVSIGIGDTLDGSIPSVRIESDGGSYSAIYSNGIGNESTSSIGTGTPGPFGASPARGDIVELRLTLAETGAVTLYQSVNGAAESSGPIGSAIGLADTWGTPYIYINSAGIQRRAFGAYSAVKVARGIQSLAMMRSA